MSEVRIIQQWVVKNVVEDECICEVVKSANTTKSVCDWSYGLNALKESDFNKNVSLEKGQ